MSFLDITSQNTAQTPAFSGAPITIGGPMFGPPPAAAASSLSSTIKSALIGAAIGLALAYAVRAMRGK